MSALQHHNLLLPRHSSPRHFHPPHSSHRQPLITIRSAAATTTPFKNNQNQNQNQKELVAVLQPQHRTPHIYLTTTDPGLTSTWTHRAWLATGCAAVLFSLLKAAILSARTRTSWLQPLLACYTGYVLADLGSGLYHWAIDNYGDKTTPVLGAQLEAAQGHHRWPWTITRRQCANNVHALARAVALSVLPLSVMCNNPAVLGFLGTFAGCVMFCQQCHAWAHGTRSRLPPVVAALQDAGVLLSRVRHQGHHRPPYNSNYCIVSGMWNGVLDENKVFEVLEKVVYVKLGVKPKSWSGLDYSDTIEEEEDRGSSDR
ncbi:unnamed protein product [Linum trigynum]|uniref:Lipid desaturase domain-containing protein n=1 Tax=Linum trigynum TaxID=586398 RepID=A0AAV2CEI0_9ROSI